MRVLSAFAALGVLTSGAAAQVVSDTATAFRLSSTFRAASERALPAVVFISVTAPPGRVARGNFEVPEELRPFFDQFGFTLPDSMAVPPQQGSGSGFIIDAQGHIMTNHHVVGNATRILVRLLDGREYEARLVGSDANTDVALIRIDPLPGETLPVSVLGDSDELRVGDWVLALGNPLGFDFTVTAGIVSAKGRQLVSRETALEAYIQTDAAINRGNSGGPLVDLYGRVVAMNTAISGPTFVGYGFAVPIGLARRVVEDLQRYGFVRRPRIGVYVQDVTAVDAEVYGLREVRGAEITAVQPGEAGAEAGLRAGDVVLAIDAQPIRNRIDFTERLARRQPGDRVQLTVWRDRAERQVAVRLGEFERAEPATAVAPADTVRAPQRLGFTARGLRPEESARSAGRGVAIASVERLGPLAGQVRAGTVLLSINGQAVDSVEDVVRLARRVEPGRAVSLRLLDAELGEMVVNYRAPR
ncbi:MAG TPA: trypsin-like peptidase domain-containing protein [Longimicrobiales bacterium]|nr:trypsin-like peptidase domain-containing protein [Longimicrobiales bacterium]